MSNEKLLIKLICQADETPSYHWERRARLENRILDMGAPFSSGLIAYSAIGNVIDCALEQYKCAYNIMRDVNLQVSPMGIHYKKMIDLLQSQLKI